ncbi:glycoside hydrolase family 39 protein [Piedraia hortae CBS 480.64]|uniref:Glycoside hydrolase family 39 protein n=1 Tax=Piedraia hortae CBS 480.64 TaxID=1314780 RepID=A0A6A7BSD2_9PEZI|nr:glycoside hydrolase family 39 protein [Piedraia hortae CBS 480.64]
MKSQLYGIFALSFAGWAAASPIERRAVINQRGFGLQWLNEWGGSDLIEEDLKLADDIGATWQRIPAWWKQIQAGGKDSFDWTGFDLTMQAAHNHGKNILVLLTSTPDFAKPAGAPYGDEGMYYPPTDNNYFATFATRVAQHCLEKGWNVKDFEIWNEPNMQRFWQTGVNPTEYGNLLAAGANALWSIDESYNVVSAGLATIYNDTPKPNETWRPQEFLNGLYAGGFKDKFASLGFHAYPVHDPSSSTSPWEGWEMMRETRKIMEDNGDSYKFVWVTEFGTTTDYYQYPEDQSGLLRDENWQARTYQSGAEEYAKTPWLGPLFAYEVHDSQDKDGKVDPENHYGLRRVDGSDKPAVQVIKDDIGKFT